MNLNAMLALSLLLVAIVFAQTVAADDFNQCFCYQSNGQWCGEETDDVSGFWRNSCSTWFTDALLWTIPAFLALITFCFYPFVICCARVCCNCCGGKEPSDGCCCPSRPSVRVLQDGTEEVIPKKYSNRSVFCTKFMYAAVFGLWIYYSVGVYVLNHDVHNAILDVTNNIDAQSTLLNDTIQNAYDAAVQLEGAPFMSESFATTLTSASQKYTTVAHDIHKIMSRIQDAESQQQYGRNQDAYRVPSISLVVLLPAFILMLCNCRGGVMTVASGLFSITAVLVLSAFIVHEVIAQGSAALCSNYNSTFVPSMISAAIYGGGCGNQDVTQTMDTQALAYFQDSCSAGIETLCGANGVFNCGAAAAILCSGTDGSSQASSATQGLSGWAYMVEVLNTTYLTATTTADAACSATTTGCTISQCAANCFNPTLRQSCQSVSNFMNSYSSPMAVILQDFYVPYTNCTGLYNALLSPAIQGKLCGEFNTQFTNISIQFLALSVLCIPATILLLLGAKRFVKMVPLADASGTEITATSSPATFTYRVLLQTDEERAVMGTPLLNDQAAPPPPYVQGGYYVQGIPAPAQYGTGELDNNTSMRTVVN